MAKKKETEELLENPEVLAEKLEGAEQWVEQNPKIVFGVVGALLLVAAGYFGFTYYVSTQDAQAQREMFQAIYYFEADSLSLALNGDGNNLGFIDIIDEYKFTDAANLAHFYAGVAFLKQGQFEAARLYLKDFSSKDLLVQARAYSLIGDSYMEEQNYEEAATFYNKAAGYKPNKFFTPAYLMKAALAYEKLNQNNKAIEAYDKIINQYWESAEYQNARKYKARLESNS
ncbi:MAG: tetratricopeptide repeat protein [Cyclobacteriaceae bacterium]|jgi:tetratricopeptide (TPR) repeat protein|nr:tetratricopeptide repeat protein [Cyclobacteriaceae bacterium]